MKLKQHLSNIAPLLGNLIGGPLGSSVEQAVSKTLLGKSNASERELEKALINISAEKLIKLKEIDAYYQTQLLSLQDRVHARQRAFACQDKVPCHTCHTHDAGLLCHFGGDDVCTTTG